MWQVTRRQFLKSLLALPVVGTTAALAGVFMRYLRPTVKPLEYFPPPEMPLIKPARVATTAELDRPWDAKEFIFDQGMIEYTPAGIQTSRIPGLIVRLPDDVAEQQNDGNPYAAFSRICPHLGCIFKYKTDPNEVESKFNFRPKNPVCACPCHLSVFDLAQKDKTFGTVGKVVSGPAPRPPRKFTFHVDGKGIVVTDLEAGGIA